MTKQSELNWKMHKYVHSSLLFSAEIGIVEKLISLKI